MLFCVVTDKSAIITLFAVNILLYYIVILFASMPAMVSEEYVVVINL